MTIYYINTGTSPNKGDGDPLRTAFNKINQNFTYLSTASFSGGTAGGKYAIDGGNAASDVTGEVLVDVSTVLVNILGSVSTINGQLIINGVTGKIELSALPNSLPAVFNLTANFNSTGNLSNLTNLPTGWSYSQAGNIVTINHNIGRQPFQISYWGYSVTEGQRLRFPTAGYQVSRTTTSPYSFTMNLNAAVTGADNNQYAVVGIMFV